MAQTMGIQWKQGEELFAAMEEQFLLLGKPAISMNHYDLEEHTEFPAGDWQQFILDARVADWVNKEFGLIKNSEFKKIITDINDSKSVGQAQIINSLNKMIEDVDTRAVGPAFIYCYVPPDKNQEHCDNVRKLEADVFAQA